MRDFARLFAELDATTSTQAKVEALQRHLSQVDLRDAAWAVYFLAGGKPRQAVPVSVLAAAACEEAGLAPWLFEESYQAVGDLAETISLVLPPGDAVSPLGLADWMEQRLLPLRGQPPEAVAAQVRAWWRELDTAGRFLLVKLVGGGFRVGMSRLLVQRALARHAGLDPKQVAQRMMGFTDARRPPTAESLQALLAPAPPEGEGPASGGQPYPFFLAHPLQEEAGDTPLDARLGPVDDWLVEWKYDGIRAQVVRRDGQAWIWSRGEELVTERFPEVQALAAAWPEGTVVDGEVLAAGVDGRPGSFAQLQPRITRKTLTRKVLAESPVTFIAYDLLEEGGRDLRALPLRERRARLEALAAQVGLSVSPAVREPSWEAFARLRETSRARGVEGFMVKRLDAAYGVGRTKADGLWWKWKVDPMTVDAVLVYAQAGHGRRASVYTDYTFAVWSRAPADAAEAQAVVEAIARREPPLEGGLQLVPFAKAYSGLSDEEFRRVDAVIRRSTVDKFGPVRSVRPALVFELGFEGIQRSGRHRSGIAVRFPRMLRIRDDKPLHEAGTLAELESLLSSHSASSATPATPGIPL